MTSLATADLAHTLIALAAILLCAHGMGSLFVRFRQPRAIGEILGGLLLGATVLGWVWPSAQDWMFPADGSTSIILGAVYQLGLCCCCSWPGLSFAPCFIVVSDAPSRPCSQPACASRSSRAWVSPR